MYAYEDVDVNVHARKYDDVDEHDYVPVAARAMYTHMVAYVHMHIA